VVTAALLMVAMAVCGVGASLWIDLTLRFEERLVVGVMAGVVLVTATSFGYFLLAGMGTGTVVFAVLVPGCVAITGFAQRGDRLRAEWASAGRRLALPARRRASLRPLVVFTALSTAVCTRTFALAYQTTDAGVSAGSLATWADWAAHHAYAGSFAYGDNRSLDLPLASGQPLKYHFLANYVGSLFTTTGLTLTRALVLSAWLVAVCVPVLMWCAVERITGSRATALVSILLFILSGGVGAWFFLQRLVDDGWGTLSALPETYARMPDRHLWVDNTISASLYAQRSTLFGVAFGLTALLLVLASRPRWSRTGFAAAGVLVGVTGITHVHMLFSGLALGAMAFVADRRDRRRLTWLWFLVPAAVIGLPMALAIAPERNSIRWEVGWMSVEAGQPWIVFWLRNVGLVLPLFVLIGVLGGVPARVARLSLPLWLWFVVPNLVAFHPSDWNNTKFFLFWQFAAAVVIASFVVTTVQRAGARRHLRLAAIGLAVVVVAAGTVTGALDTVRGMQRSAAIPWVDHDDVAAGLWLRDHAVDDGRLVYGASNTSAVAALSGVPALSGYPGWTDDLGLDDWDERWAATGQILSGGPEAERLVADYGIRYIAIGPRERGEYAASDSYWEAHATKVFEQGEYRIYEI
jgi:hypothetical protein